jgi:hypothetical protein
VLALGAGAVAWWARRRYPLLAWIAGISGLAVALGFVSVTRVVGPLLSYLFYWTSALPVPAFLAGAVLAAELLSRADRGLTSRRAQALLGSAVAIGCVVASIGLVRSVLRDDTVSYGFPQASQPIADLVEQRLGDDRSRPLAIRVLDLDPSSSFAAQAVVLALAKDGFPIHVRPPWDTHVSDRQGQAGGEAWEVILRPAQLPNPPGDAEPLGTRAPLDVFLRRL